jgi:DNA repair protein RecN (Recombination protein N)
MQITNFALIDQAVFEPGRGFSGITGETGAGKSLLIDAISALCGQRVGRDAVRTGAERAIIEACYDNASSTLTVSDYDAFGILPESDDILIISREILSDGRSNARINGRLVTLGALKDIGSKLIDIHGQNDQQAIFQKSKHLDLLDRFGGSSISDAIAQYAEQLTEYRQCIEEIKSLGTDPEARAKRAELLLFQINELEEASFQDNEEEELMQKKRSLASFERIQENLRMYKDLMEDSDESVIPRLSGSRQYLTAAAGLDPQLARQVETLKSCEWTLQGILSDIDKYLDKKEAPTESLSSVEKRLDILFRFKVKYGRSIPEMKQFLIEAKREYDTIVGSEKRLSELHHKRLQIEKSLMERADAIHMARVKAAADLSKNIMHELSDLGMEGSVFRVLFTQRPRDRFFSRTGYDEAEFMMSANAGEPEKPLAKIASGGEASRIMLAIKTILASADDTPTLIFDEIDAGISGATATAVAHKMARLAKSHQVLCVTHMAQIAASTDHHYLIEKRQEGGRTVTSIRILNPGDREQEIARLLSGEKEDHFSLDLAKQMIERKVKP